VTAARGRRAARTEPRLRAVVTDIDGTLTDRDRRLDPTAIDAVRRLEAKGIPVLLATGNVLPVALAIHRCLGLSSPIIAENGGMVYWPMGRGGRIERRSRRSAALRALRTLRAAGLPVRSLFTDRWRETEVAIEPTVSVRKIRALLSGSPLLVESTGFAIHIMDAHGGKLEATRSVLARLGLTLEDCLTLGDGDNDVGLLREAGVAVSFRSGSPAARRAADYITKARHAGGSVEGVIHAGLLPGRASGARETHARR
jgi:phosphoglycolate phosphatase